MIGALWPIAKWILQALGLMGPEDKEKEREYQLRLLEAQQENEAALRTAFAQFQQLWRPSAERVYVWANTAIALFQPTIIALVYYDAFVGPQKAVQVADRYSTSIGGLLIMSIMLFPFYGPALVTAVGSAFQTAVDLAAKRRGNGRATGPELPARPSPPSGNSPSLSDRGREVLVPAREEPADDDWPKPGQIDALRDDVGSQPVDTREDDVGRRDRGHDILRDLEGGLDRKERD
jgi:hypothetical protein